MFASARLGKVPARGGVGARSPASDDVSKCTYIAAKSRKCISTRSA